MRQSGMQSKNIPRNIMCNTTRMTITIADMAVAIADIITAMNANGLQTLDKCTHFLPLDQINLFTI